MAAIRKKPVFKIIFLAVIWMVLRGESTPFDLALGLALGAACVAYAKKFLPLKTFENVKYFRILLYIFYLIGQMYLAAFGVIGIILKDRGRIDIVKVKTSLENESLKFILGESITLTPGSVLIDLKGDELTLIMLAKEKEVIEDYDRRAKGSLEAKLLACQKSRPAE